MSPLTQDKALEPLGPRDRARFWRVDRHDALDCLAASFVNHTYAPHSHETFAIGVMVQGAETFRLRGAVRLAPAGALCFVNPGEVHDGVPVEGGYAYRMSYPSEALMRAVAEEASGRTEASPPFFVEPIVQDATTAELFLRAHRAFGEDGDALAADEAFVAAYALMIERHGGGRPSAALGSEGGPVKRARELLDDRLTEAVSLDEVAAVARLSRRHLLRAFARETGLTPHAYQTNARVRLARHLLRAGAAPAEVAAACGFCDQSHLNRAFKARLGVTPGAFRGTAALSSKTPERRAA